MLDLFIQIGQMCKVPEWYTKFKLGVYKWPTNGVQMDIPSVAH